MHAPGHLRDAFGALVDDDPAAYDDVFDDEALPPLRLLAELSLCGDVMPGSLCQQLGLPRGCYYAEGVGVLLKERSEESLEGFLDS